jgi:hypothetical protein
LLSFIRMIFISSFCMVNLYVFNVEHLVEPSISPEKWPTGVIIQ